MRLIYFLAVLVSTTATAQVVVIPMTAGEAVLDMFQGVAVTISNITFNGQPDSTTHTTLAGYTFEGPAVIPSSGILMATGALENVSMPASHLFTTHEFTGGDQDLQLLSGGITKDAMILEFDFIPDEDLLTFEYVFASEEYPEYVCSLYNDVFGFFLSGPGISGPHQNNAVNLAILPNSQTPVMINTVNNGVPWIAYASVICDSIDPNWTENTIYFVDNTDSTYHAFDGQTVILPVTAQVIPGAQYHMKIGVADALDMNNDSGIFLRYQSFSSVPSTSTSIGRHQKQSGSLHAWFNEQGALIMDTGTEKIELIRLFDVQGRLLIEKRIDQSGRILVEGLTLPNGVVLVEAIANDSKLRSKLVKH